jgi:hypothetical protein
VRAVHPILLQSVTIVTVRISYSDQARQAAQVQLEEELESERESRLAELHAAEDARAAEREEAAMVEAKQLNALKAHRLVTLSAQIATEVAVLRAARIQEMEDEVAQIKVKRLDETVAAGASSVPQPASSDATTADLSSHRSAALAAVDAEVSVHRRTLEVEFDQTRARLTAELIAMRDAQVTKLRVEQVEKTQAMQYELENQKQDVKRQWFKEVSRCDEFEHDSTNLGDLSCACAHHLTLLCAYVSGVQWGASIHSWLAHAKERSLPLDVLLDELALHLHALAAERERRTLKKVPVSFKPRPKPNVGLGLMPGTNRNSPSKLGANGSASQQASRSNSVTYNQLQQAALTAALAAQTDAHKLNGNGNGSTQPAQVSMSVSSHASNAASASAGASSVASSQSPSVVSTPRAPNRQPPPKPSETPRLP